MMSIVATCFNGLGIAIVMRVTFIYICLFMSENTDSSILNVL